MKTFGYTPYGSFNAIKLFACLSMTEANKLMNTYKEWLCIVRCYNNGRTHKPKYSIEGMLPHSSMRQWLGDLRVAIAHSKAHFAQQNAIAIEAEVNGTTYHYLDNQDMVPHDAFIDDADDLPF